jgi:hypothetical protein
MGDTDQNDIPIGYQGYRIRVKGHLDYDWSVWFEGLTITLEDDGTTLLSGPVCDQAALYGLLKKINELGLPLISFNQVEVDEQNIKRKGEIT